MNKYLSIEDIISIPYLSSPAVNQEGTKVAWVESVPNWDRNKYLRTVRVYDAGADTAFTVPPGVNQSSNPSWSVSGKLAWTDGGDDNQVYTLIDGKAVQVTHGRTGVVSYRWAPDGGGLYYLGPDIDQKERLKNRRDQYGDFECEDLDYVWNSLYYQELESGIARSLAAQAGPRDLRLDDLDKPARYLAGDHKQHILSFDISPDNSRIVFSAAPTPRLEDGEKAELYLLNLSTGDYEALITPKPLDEYSVLLFSPDSAHICYTRPINEGKWYNITTLEVQELATGQTSQPLLDLDECIYPVSWTDRGLVFTWQQKTDWQVSLLDNSGEILPLRGQPGLVTRAVSISRDGLHLATLTASKEQPFELFLKGKPVTNQGKFYKNRTISQREVISWQSQDGTTIEGILITQPGQDRDKPRPLLVIVHGGPATAALAIPTASTYYPYEQFIEKGFIILDVNYRGSSGYGEAFRKLNYRNLGIGDYQDVISGVDWLVAQGVADNDCVGVMGWSQGGYISAMCTTYSNRFKAVSVGAGVSNWYTYYNNTDVPPFTRHYLGSTPWIDPEVYAKTSPMAYIHQACTPTLIQHGDLDTRVPYANGRELYRGLKDMGVQVQLITFPGMGHGAGKPGISRAIMKQNFHWFCHHLLGEEIDESWLPV